MRLFIQGDAVTAEDRSSMCVCVVTDGTVGHIVCSIQKCPRAAPLPGGASSSLNPCFCLKAVQRHAKLKSINLHGDRALCGLLHSLGSLSLLRFNVARPSLTHLVLSSVAPSSLLSLLPPAVCWSLSASFLWRLWL